LKRFHIRKPRGRTYRWDCKDEVEEDEDAEETRIGMEWVGRWEGRWMSLESRAGANFSLTTVMVETRRAQSRWGYEEKE